MLGISYGELFLLLGATAAFIGPKDLPKIARTAGRLAGRAIGYVQLARGQVDNILQQSQASQVHKELQDAMMQLEAIRFEMRSFSLMRPGPMTRSLVDGGEFTPIGTDDPQKLDKEQQAVDPASKGHGSTPVGLGLATLHSEATTYEILAKSSTLNRIGAAEKLSEDSGLLTILPISAESAGLLPERKDDIKGSDIMLEAIIEAEVAGKARHFVANQIRSE